MGGRLHPANTKKALTFEIESNTGAVGVREEKKETEENERDFVVERKGRDNLTDPKRRKYKISATVSKENDPPKIMTLTEADLL